MIPEGGWGTRPHEALPQPITLAGLTVRPGDPVVLVAKFWTGPRIFVGVCPRTGGAVLAIDREAMTTGDSNAPGPWPLDALRHPDWLGGFAKEIDAE